MSNYCKPSNILYNFSCYVERAKVWTEQVLMYYKGSLDFMPKRCKLVQCYWLQWRNWFIAWN